MRAIPIDLATLDEAAGPLRKLRAALAGTGVPTDSRDAPPLLDLIRERPGSALYDLAAASSLSVADAEAETRRLARAGLAEMGAGEDGVMRWWPREAPGGYPRPGPASDPCAGRRPGTTGRDAP